jgi:hypothetical protein
LTIPTFTEEVRDAFCIIAPLSMVTAGRILPSAAVIDTSMFLSAAMGMPFPSSNSTLMSTDDLPSAKTSFCTGVRRSEAAFGGGGAGGVFGLRRISINAMITTAATATTPMMMYSIGIANVVGCIVGTYGVPMA